MLELHPVDYSIVIGYFVVLTIIGYFVKKKGS